MNPDQDPRRRTELIAVGALAAFVLAVVVIVVSALSSPDPEDALAEFLAGWQTGQYEAAAERTDGDPQAVAAALEANVEGLDGATLDGAISDLSDAGSGEKQASVEMNWEVPEIGGFSYTNDTIRLVKEDGRWLVRWSERVIHPELNRGERLGTEADQPDRAPILDRGGKEIVSMRPAVEVGAVPGEVEDVRATAAAVAEATGANEKTFRQAIRAADEEAFVPAITLRQEEFAPIEEQMAAIPGVQWANLELPLAPTRDFARALLGTVGPATAEQIEESGGELQAGDVIGQGGLQAAFDEQLAGTPDRSVVIRNAEGKAVEELATVEGEEGEPLQTTLHTKTQNAAEAALRGVDGKAALVAIEPATGDLLAVANRPTDDGFNRALAGQYPPGSTFKVISTAALLGAGLDPDEIVECPETINFGGRDFVNFEGSAAGAVPFATDFAQSCNTAFVSLAGELERRDLTRTGKAFGLGRDYELAVEAYPGEVPPPEDEVEAAAAMIGQARILASPMAMAGVAAAVANGVWRRPRLLAGDESVEGPALDPDQVEVLRSLMRSVITSGTGIALAAVPGEPIGKSGTAEYGSGDPPPTHAWFIAAREDIAVAVLVEDAPSGGEVAAPIAADFLTRTG